ncbi:MAG: hypothetical protein HRT69_17975 [Flavobacteriaceae bacterium]|nr:hypothetical protein [Flavobacteriaceae bacterium]
MALKDLDKSVIIKFDLVDKGCYESDYGHAPYATIEADTRNEAKVIYNKNVYSEGKYIDVLCRNSRKGSFNK